MAGTDVCRCRCRTIRRLFSNDCSATAAPTRTPGPARQSFEPLDSVLNEVGVAEEEAARERIAAGSSNTWTMCAKSSGASKERAATVRRSEVPEAPIGIPTDFEEHIKLMFDLQVLAWQADITRISTL